MPLTQLDSQSDNVKSVKVRIIADTVIERNGMGVPIYVGSVLSVKPSEANTLINCHKAERAKADEPEEVFYKPKTQKAAAPASK